MCKIAVDGFPFNFVLKPDFRIRGEERWVVSRRRCDIEELCPRALQVLKRHLALRAELSLQGKINHDDLFFKDDGTPIRYLQYPWVRWKQTLQRMKVCYREPYNARHSSASWNLMIGKNPLWLAPQSQQLNSAAYGAVLTSLRDDIGSVNFAQLPDNTQQALMDFAWLQDSGYLTSTTTGQQVQSYVEGGEWLLLADYLEANAGLRRALDAAKFRQDIASGKLPECGQPC
jgi:hypothetical protein